MKKNLIKIPEFATKADAYSYLRKNSKDIIAQKRAFPTTTDDLEFGYSIIQTEKKFTTKSKDGGEVQVEDAEVKVDIIANMSGWCDSQMDVMIEDNWNKSIKDLGASGQRLFYHLKDHGERYQYTLGAVIGRDPELYTKDVSLDMFNFKSDIKKAQGLLMTSTVPESYDCKAYQLYRDKQIKQHSIGLQYIKIYLCMDSEEDEDAMYKDNWKKYYKGVLNKERVDARGYFWAITESKILEVSAVLFGSNELTNVISTDDGSKSTSGEPETSTLSQPHKDIETFDVGLAILTTKFFKN